MSKSKELTMAFTFYDVGEHPDGFVGFRVLTKKKNNVVYKQRYFSLDDYTYVQAQVLAQLYNNKWNCELDLVNAQLLVNPTKHPVNRILPGLRAVIDLDKGVKQGVTREYLVTSFVVDVNLNADKSSFKSFRTNTVGYDQAFLNAIKEYIKVRELPEDNLESLLELKPNPDIFTGFLFNRLSKRTDKYTVEDVIQKLNLNT